MKTASCLLWFILLSIGAFGAHPASSDADTTKRLERQRDIVSLGVPETHTYGPLPRQATPFLKWGGWPVIKKDYGPNELYLFKGDARAWGYAGKVCWVFIHRGEDKYTIISLEHRLSREEAAAINATDWVVRDKSLRPHPFEEDLGCVIERFEDEKISPEKALKDATAVVEKYTKFKRLRLVQRVDQK